MEVKVVQQQWHSLFGAHIINHQRYWWKTLQSMGSSLSEFPISNMGECRKSPKLSWRRKRAQERWVTKAEVKRIAKIKSKCEKVFWQHGWAEGVMKLIWSLLTTASQLGFNFSCYPPPSLPPWVTLTLSIPCLPIKGKLPFQCDLRYNRNFYNWLQKSFPWLEGAISLYCS